MKRRPWHEQVVKPALDVPTKLAELLAAFYAAQAQGATA